jgi:CheY-like chemotaxis protein
MSELGRILIADDEERFMHSTAAFLRQEGYECACAPDAATVAAMLREDPYDLLIADIKMPGNRNLELIRELSHRAEELSVILVTGCPSLQSAIQSIRLPVVASGASRVSGRLSMRWAKREPGTKSSGHVSLKKGRPDVEEQNAVALEQAVNFLHGKHPTATTPLAGNNSTPTQSGEGHMAAQHHTTAEQESHFPTKLYMDLLGTWSSSTRKMAEYYFTTGEQLAKDAMALQKRATKWAKDTIPLLEEQNNVTQEFLARPRRLPIAC